MEFVDAGDAKKRENVRLSENGDKEWYPREALDHDLLTRKLG